MKIHEIAFARDQLVKSDTVHVGNAFTDRDF
jgi:hypothetical protein